MLNDVKLTNNYSSEVLLAFLKGKRKNIKILKYKDDYSLVLGT